MVDDAIRSLHALFFTNLLVLLLWLLTWPAATEKILFLQWQSVADLQGLTTGWLFSAGAVGLLFSTVIFAIVAIELRRVRKTA